MKGRWGRAYTLLSPTSQLFPGRKAAWRATPRSIFLWAGGCPAQGGASGCCWQRVLPAYCVPSTGSSATLWARWPWVQEEATQDLTAHLRSGHQMAPWLHASRGVVWMPPGCLQAGVHPTPAPVGSSGISRPCGEPAISGMRKGPRSQASRARQESRAARMGPGLCVGGP